MDIEQLAEILFEAFALEHNLTASFANLGEARQQVWLAVAEAAHAHYAKPAALAQDHFAQARKMVEPVVLPEPGINTANHASVRVIGYTEQQVRELLDNTKRSTNRDDESVGLREALVRAHDWMDSQADSQSKGGHETFDLMMLRAERNAIKSALDESPQPQEVPVFNHVAALKLKELQERGYAITGYAFEKVDSEQTERGFITSGGFVGWWKGEHTNQQPQADARDSERYRWLRDKWLGNEPEAINMERAKGQRGLDAAIDAAIAAAKEMK